MGFADAHRFHGGLCPPLNDNAGVHLVPASILLIGGGIKKAKKLENLTRKT